MYNIYKYLLVENSYVKKMVNKGGKTSEKDEGEVKSTPSSQEIASSMWLVRKVQSFIFVYFVLFCFLP
jgi:hypothetical protein